MTRPRFWEPLLLLAVAFAAPLAVAVWLGGSSRTGDAGAPPADLPFAAVLASTREERSMPLGRWLEVAVDSPWSFHRALGFCQRRSEWPRPNCRNVAVVDRVCTALGAEALAESWR